MTMPSPAHHQARRSHLALQARREALAKIRAGEFVNVRLCRSAGGVTVRARALADGEDPVGRYVLVILGKRLRSALCTDKYGLRAGNRNVRRKDILGVVLLIDEVDPCASSDAPKTRI